MILFKNTESGPKERKVGSIAILNLTILTSVSNGTIGEFIFGASIGLTIEISVKALKNP